MSEAVLCYLAFWPVLAVIGVANGIVRGLTYGRWLRERSAHQLSTLSAAVLTGIAVFAFAAARPIPDAATAVLIGGLWLLLTVAFEFLFGRYVAKEDFARLIADYDLTRGRVWPLFLAWLTLLPWLVYRI